MRSSSLRSSVLAASLFVLSACSEDAAMQNALVGAAGQAGMQSPITPASAGASGGAGIAAGAGAGAAGSSGTPATMDPGAGTGGQGGAAAGAGGGAGQATPPVAGSAGSAAPDGCDRACLVEVMSAYLDALVAHDHATLPVAANLKYTDNGEPAQLGQGLWMTASALQPGRRLDFADPQEGQVASQLALDESGATPVIYQVRLKVVDHEITEIESMTVRRRGAANGFFTPENMEPEPVFLQAIEPAKRMTREQLTAELDLYVDYLEGTKDASEVHFDQNCARYENGVSTARGLASFEAQNFWSFDVTRRYLVIDEEAGIIWGMLPFSQSSSALVVGEAFKIFGGKIMMIQAVMANIPTRAWD